MSVPRSFVAFDLEATGLSAKSDQIIEVGAVRMDADLETVDTFEVLVDPGMPIPLAVQRLTGIGDSDVRGACTPAEAMAQFADFCAGAELVAHGSVFDMAFCVALLPEAFGARIVYDTLELARILHPAAASHSLPLLSARLGIPHLRPHRAGSDAAATGVLFRLLATRAAGFAPALAREMDIVLEDAAGSLGRFFSDVVPAAAASAPPHRAAGPGPATGAGPAGGVPAPRARSRVEGGDLSRRAAALLGPDGPFADAPQFELREAQVEMARAVAQTLDRGRRLMVEAGTGLGKSLGYLVPLALWADGTGRRAVVATHTISLQEQLVERDLPDVLARLDLPVRAAMLKGRQHYLSLRRWERFLHSSNRGPHGVDLDAVRFKLKLLVWVSETATGDRAELRLAAEEERLWSEVQSEADDCLGAGCANWREGRCFMVAARRAAAEAGIVVTNQALLVAGAERQGPVLPGFDALVVDEAHHLEEVATRQLGIRLRAADVLRVLDRLQPPRGAAGEGGALDLLAARCRDAVHRVFGEVRGYIGDVEGSDQPGNTSVGLSAEARAADRFHTLARAGRHASTTLREGASQLRDLQGATPSNPASSGGVAGGELDLCAQALSDAAAAIDGVLGPPSEGLVAWLELRAEQAELRAAPVTVADRLRGSLFDRVDASILTSATLSVRGSFDFVRSRTGIGAGADELLLASPFDYLSQALCVLASDVPRYDEPGHDAAIADICAQIVIRLGGSTMALFTGYSSLRRVHALLSGRLEHAGIAVLGQGLDGTRRQVLASFVSNPRSLLLGTSSFWEGIDVPGDALRCVIVAKLPFPVPTDPLVQARAALVEDGFRDLALPQAVLRLKQGFGRLIRRSTDRGAVVLCDPRLGARDYGSAFLEALPRAAMAREPRAGIPALVAAFVTTGVLPPTAAALPTRPDPALLVEEPA